MPAGDRIFRPIKQEIAGGGQDHLARRVRDIGIESA